MSLANKTRILGMNELDWYTNYCHDNFIQYVPFIRTCCTTELKIMDASVIDFAESNESSGYQWKIMFVFVSV